jgi:hypothetical protein
LVSNRDVPIDRETIPVHLVSDEPISKVRELAEVVLATEQSWDSIGAFLGAAHPELWKEIRAMAKKRSKGDIDWKAFWDKVLDAQAKNRFADFVIDHVTTLPAKEQEVFFRRLQANFEKRKQSPTSKN